MSTESDHSNQSLRSVAHRAAGAVLWRRFVDETGYWLIWTLGGALVLIVFSRLIGWDSGSAMWWGWLIAAGAAAMVPSGISAMRARLSDAQGAGVLDDRLGLKSQIRSAIELDADREMKEQMPGFVALAIAQAESAAGRVEVQRAMDPIETRHWKRAGVVLALAAAVGIWMPMRDEAVRGSAPAVPEQAIAQIDSAQGSIEKTIEAEGSPAAQEAIEELESLKKELAQGVDDPEQANARTAAKLEELADALDEQAQQDQADANELADRIAQAQNQDEQLGDQQLDDFAQAIKEQEYADAQRELESLREQLDQMSDSQREELADQLEQLADAVEPDSVADESLPEESANESANEPAQELADSLREEAEQIREPEPESKPEPKPQPESDQSDQQSDQQPEEQSEPQGGESTQDQSAADQQEKEGQQKQSGEKQSGEQQPSDQSGEEQAEQQESQGDQGDQSKQTQKQGENQSEQEQQGEKQEGQRPGQGEQGEQEDQPGQDQPGEQPNEQPGEERQEQQGESGQSGESDQQEQQQQERQGQRSLDETLQDMERRKEQAQRSQEQADEIREQARELIEPNPSQEPSQTQEQGEEGEGRTAQPDENQPEQQGSPGDGPRTGEDEPAISDPDAVRDFVPVDASGTGQADNAKPVGKWYAPDGEAPDPGSAKQTAQRFNEAAEQARQSVIGDKVPRKYRRVVREAFKRVQERADAMESGGKVAPQGKDATPKSKTSSSKSGADK
jgi:hypothetical protein